MNTRLLRLAALPALLLCAATAALAQALLPSAGTAPKPATADEAVVLSPFEVNSGADAGYQAGNTTSGSRLNTKLKDTSAPITPFTPEFLSDFALTNIEEIMAYSANFEKDVEDSNAGFNAPAARSSAASNQPFRIRGIIGSFAVDQVESAVPQDTFNIDRVEVSSGPNSVLFGLGAAGGTIALTSKQANVRRDFATTKFTGGSWNFQRAELDFNRTLVRNTLALRLNALDAHANGYRSFDFTKSRRVAAAVTYQLAPSTTVRAAWDAGTHGRHTDWPWPAGNGVKGWFAASRPAINLATTPFNANAFAALGINRVDTNIRWTLVDNTGQVVNLQNQLQSYTGVDAAGVAYSADILPTPDLLPAHYSFSGPGSFLTGSYRNYSAKVEHRWHGLVLEGAFISTFNQSRANGWAVPGNSINVRGDPNATLPTPAGVAAPNAYVGRLYLENTWRPDDTTFRNEVFRLTAAYELNLGNVFGRHRIAGLAETGKIEQVRRVFQEILVNQNNVPIVNAGTPENAQNQVFRRHYATEGAYDTYYQSDPRIAFPSFTVGANTYRSRYVALNQNGNADDLKLTDTAMIAAQNYFWNDKIITTLGYRADRVKFKNGVTARLAATDPYVVSGERIVNEFAPVPGQFDRNIFKPRTFNAGVVVNPTRRLSAFYNQSNNIGAPSFAARILPPIAPPANISAKETTGESRDYGVMFDPFGDDRLFFRLTRFDTTYLDSTPIQPGTNPFQPAQGLGLGLDALVAAGRLTAAQAAPYRVNPGAFSIDVISKGWELEANANPTKNLSLRAQFSYSDRNRENFMKERDPFVPALYAFLKNVNDTGVAPITLNSLTRSPKDTITGEIDTFFDVTGSNQSQAFGSRPYKLNLNGRYRFTESALKGLALGGAVRWQSANYMQQDFRTTVNGVANPHLGKELFGHTFEAWDFFTTYRLKPQFLGAKNLTLQLNVRNAFNQSRVQPARYTNDFLGLRRVYLNEPRSFRLSAALDF
ncbi:MAG: TonB-dependent receptor plug domain-containing protein [Verrucomicrobia bacterium]|nr:TonB-dependent receptor plug domain-containing protein [Verrucomicrobiota bacterium]